MDDPYLTDLEDTRDKYEIQLELLDDPFERAKLEGHIGGLVLAISLYRAYKTVGN